MRIVPNVTLVVFLILPACCHATTPGESIESRVDAVFAAQDRSDSPGCSVGVYRDGRIIYGRGYGMANLELGARLTPHSAFEIGSTSKQFTAMSILLLAKDGKLSLDDDIRKYLPEIPDYGKTITIRHLLHHTSGIRDYCELLALAGFRVEDVTTDEDGLRILSLQKSLNFQPGEEHSYSNSGYFLMSLIVKRVSGKSLRDFARERIFDPLGMRHTQYNDSHLRIIPNRATGYDPAKDGGFNISMSDWEQTGDGSVLTTVEDLFLWDRNFYDPVVGGADTISLIQTTGKLNSGTMLDYAAGLSIGEYRGLRTVSHQGAWAGYRAQLLRFPEQKFSVACLCNDASLNPDDLAKKVAEVYLRDVMKQETPAESDAAKAPAFKTTAAELAKRAGAYRNPETARVWRLTAVDGVLSAEVSDLQFRMIPTGPDTFRGEGAPFPMTATFETVAQGARPRLRVRMGDEKEDRVLEPIEPWIPVQAQLAEMAGRYGSEELDTVATLIVEEGKLLFLHRSFGEEPMTPSIKDRFTVSGGEVVFTRNSRGRIDGFNLEAGRIRDLRFKKQTPQ